MKGRSVIKLLPCHRPDVSDAMTIGAFNFLAIAVEKFVDSLVRPVRWQITLPMIPESS